jgi:hypothetical protein
MTSKKYISNALPASPSHFFLISGNGSSSDIAGVGLGGIVERIANRLGLPDPGLTRVQMKMKTTKVTFS